MGISKWIVSVYIWLGLHEFVPERVVTSNLVSSTFLFVFRFLSSLYMTIVWCVAVAISKGSFFIFFTNLSYSGLAAYFWTVTLHTFQYIRYNDARSIREQPTWLTAALYMLYSTVVSFHVIIPVIYWSLLFNGSYRRPVEGWRDVSVHALDFVFIFVEVILNRMQMSVKLVLVPFVTMILYMFLTWIIWATQHYWVYPFLAWRPRAGYIYPCIAIFLVLIYSIVYSVHLLKERIWEKRRNRAHVDSEQSASSHSSTDASFLQDPSASLSYPAPVYNKDGSNNQSEWNTTQLINNNHTYHSDLSRQEEGTCSRYETD